MIKKSIIFITLLLIMPIVILAATPAVNLCATNTITYSVNGSAWIFNESTYLYNVSTLVDVNETALNATITSIASNYGNASWNESRTNALYILLTSEGNLNVNSSDYWDNLDVPSDLTNTHNHSYYNLTDTLFNSTDENYINLLSGNVTFNETVLNSTINDIADDYGNASWNESRADALYILLTSEGNLNVNHSNSTDWVFGVDSLADFNNSHLHSLTNITDTLFNFTDNVYIYLNSGNVTFNETALNNTIDARELTGNLTGNVTGSVFGDVVGDLTGNVTGNLTGLLFGDVTGNLTGNVTGNVFGDVVGDLTGNVTGNLTGNTFIPSNNRSNFGDSEQAAIYYNSTLGALVIEG